MLTFIPSQPLQSPVLLIIFNRPETTKIAFEAIRAAKPERLYVAADGPRADVMGDAAKCAEARKIIHQVDWSCNVKTLFHKQNLNCGVAPAAAITWFFEHEEEGIILEDDCLPSQSFFWYCQELLQRYRHDSRVMHIGGNNFFNGWQKDADYSYYFSRCGFVWGWATWRRAWATFDFKINLYQKAKEEGFFSYYFFNQFEKTYRLRKLNQTLKSKGNVDWWDYQWDFARYIHSGLAIVPNKNLVRNLGFGEMATHTTNSTSKRADVLAEDIEFPLRHPPFMIRDAVSDKKYFYALMKDAVKSKLNPLLRA